MKPFLLFCLVLLTLALNPPVAKADGPFDDLITYDCVCVKGRWKAACPQAIATWPGGIQEPHANVRRCERLNPDAPDEEVCEEGTTRDIYESPAPAMTNLCKKP